MTFLVISDIHYGGLAQMEGLGKSAPASIDAMKEIACNVKDALDGQNLPPEYLLVLGDLTSRGSPGEFKEVSEFIRILAQEIEVSDEKIILTYGNHDVDWSICKLISKPPERKHAYCEVAANIGSMYTPCPPFTSEGPVVGSGVYHFDGLDFVVLNSGIECFDDQLVRHGSLANEQYDWLENVVPSLLRTDTTKVMILHHHLVALPYAHPVQDLSPLSEGANVLQIIGNLGIHMVLHGHRHHPIIFTEIQGGWKSPVTFVCAGSFGVIASERASGRIPNTMHVLEVNSADISGHQGKVTTFEQNASEEWIPLRANYTSYPINPVQWFGSANFRQTSTADIQSVLDSAVDDFTIGGYIGLPRYDDLDLPLRCLSLPLLNETFKSKAMSMGYTITGSYPEKCIITEKI